MCEAIETYGNDKRNEGRAEGKLEKARKMAIELYKNGVSVATIASAAGVPAGDRRKFCVIDKV